MVVSYVTKGSLVNCVISPYQIHGVHVTPVGPAMTARARPHHQVVHSNVSMGDALRTPPISPCDVRAMRGSRVNCVRSPYHHGWSFPVNQTQTESQDFAQISALTGARASYNNVCASTCPGVDRTARSLRVEPVTKTATETAFATLGSVVAWEVTRAPPVGMSRRTHLARTTATCVASVWVEHACV